ncbi:MAG TPA: hypothetical protein VEV81_13875 [Pyrinomonadaceae bacterium]|nr:hypothetical protein [Pyrinomonadaceae bacterium]
MIEDIPPDQPPLLLDKQEPPFECPPQEDEIDFDNLRDTYATIEPYQFVAFATANTNTKPFDVGLRQERYVGARIQQHRYVGYGCPG